MCRSLSDALGLGAYAVKIVVENEGGEFDIRSFPYTGFMIFSRKYCGAEFLDSILSGETKMLLMDLEAVYEVRFLYHRKDRQQTSLTVQFEQTALNSQDLPLDNTGSDHFFLYFQGVPDHVTVSDEEACFQPALGVLPVDFEDRNEDWTLCTGWEYWWA